MTYAIGRRHERTLRLRSDPTGAYNMVYLASLRYAQIFAYRQKLQIYQKRYIKFRILPCDKLLNANIIGESDGT